MAADIDLNGKCSALDPDTRTFTIKDTAGAPHPFKWIAGPLDDVMKKWKVGYYLTVKFDPDTYTVKNVTYWQEGKDAFPKNTGGGGRSYQPRNEKPMIFESVFKSCCDCASNHENFQNQTYEDRMERIWTVAKKISLEIVKESGA